MRRQKPYGHGRVSESKKWIEEKFQKCECMQFMQDPYDENKCGCGRDKGSHDPMPYWPTGNWSWKRNTVSFPTDSYGMVEFGTGVKAQYLRMSPNSKFDDVIQLLTSLWGVEPPKLLISVHGGMTNFDLPPRLKRAFRRSLQRMAAVPGVWILTTGLNVGVVKHVGDALTAGVLRRHRAVVIGIAPWGVVANRHRLAVRDADVRYYPPATAPAATVLNPNHSFFLLIDDGTAGKYGAEAKWRRNFEQSLSSSLVIQNVPLVALLVEGGANCVRVAVDYLTEAKPVVIVEGSGRAADILSFAYRQMEADSSINLSSSGVLGENELAILNAIQRAFGVSTNRNRVTLNEVILCTKRRELISVWHPPDVQTGTIGITSAATPSNEELDLCVLSALLRAQRRSAPDQLRLALAWNRVDLAMSQIFVDGQFWPDGALNDAMMEALLMDRVDFVKLLLDRGVNMAELLTSAKLEQLYNIKHSDTWLLRHIARILINRQNNMRISLTDIGNIVDSLMGFGYRSTYHQKSAVKTVELLQNQGASIAPEAERFRYPFSDLLIWAVLMRRQGMARLMWGLGEEALAKALVACRLYRSLASFLTGDVTSETIVQLKEYAQEFADLAVELLDRCHRLDEVTAQQLLTYELHNFSDKTCLSLAVSAQHKQFVAHPCCQNLLSVLWMGGLRTRSSRPWKIVLGILFPPFALFGLDYLTQEELRLQPQTEQELEEQRMLDGNNSHSGEVSPTAFYFDEGPGLGASTRFSRLHHRDTYLQGEASIRQRPTVKTPTNVELGMSFAEPKLNDSELPPPPPNLMPTQSSAQLHSQISLSPLGRSRFSIMADLESDSGRPLNFKTRFDEFYNAPVTKFWLHTIGYMMFIACFSYTILTRQDLFVPQWPEIWITLYVITLLADKFREFGSIDAHGILARLNIYFLDLWNLFDAIAIVLFCVGLVLRWIPYLFEFGRAFWIVAMVFFLIHTFDIFQAHEDLATYITILHKMLKRMISFLIILGVVVATYGIILQATRFPYRAPEWDILKDIWVESYFNLYGEVYHEYIDTGMCDSTSTNSSDPYKPPCWCCTWIGPVAQTVYLIVANILMLNLLIAVFNNVFERVNRVSQTLTKFQRYRLIVDYQLLPALPPPFIALCHFYVACRALVRRCGGRAFFSKDPGLLKLVLSEADENQLHDFEEQARDEIMEHREAAAKNSSDEQLRGTSERTEAMQLAIEQLAQRQATTIQMLSDLEHRLNSITSLALPSPGRPMPGVSMAHTALHPMLSINANLQKLIAADDAAAHAAGQLPTTASPYPRALSIEYQESPRAYSSQPSHGGSLEELSTINESITRPDNLVPNSLAATSPTPVSAAANIDSSGSPNTPRRSRRLTRGNSSEEAAAEESSTRAIGPDVYRRLRNLSTSGDTSEYCRTARSLIAQKDMYVPSGSEVEDEEDVLEKRSRAPSAARPRPVETEESWSVPPEEPSDNQV